MNAIDPRRPPRAMSRRARKAGGIGPAMGALVAWLVGPRFHRLIDRIDSGLASGTLNASLPDGSVRILGARAPGPVCDVDLRHWRALLRLATGGSVGWYRAWAAGEWSSPDPVPLFALFMANARSLGDVARPKGAARWLGRAIHWARRNSRSGSRHNIAFHYDLGNDFYALWLDQNMHYSSALFDGVEDDLEAAQARKVDAILDRLDLAPGKAMLEIGCGWGGLARQAMARVSIRYDGLTLSVEQADYARSRLGEGARILLTDYRDAVGQYDAIASVEMIEAVGERYWPDYVAAVERLLKPGGRAAIQYILIDDAIFPGYAAAADFIQTYIFPGGMLMSESRFRSLVERQGLEWRDVRRFGADYARTLKIWRDRFDAAVEEGRLPPAFDATFVGLWRYYLMYCEGGFRGGTIDVAQVTLVKPAN
ncbi:MAG: cyclopropane-fatty-acyl-phospholipid synthase family protein [Sphingobium sp.]|nr:cyclopropane-fatty-acyl-phospholipid synthase family protein [Sphingobium sp.]